MNSSREQKISGRALWAVLWRAIVLFPLGLVLFAVPCTILCGGVMLAVWAVTFGILHQWWQAAACIAGLPVLVPIWRCYCRWSDVPPTGEQDRGGYIL